MCNVCAGGDWWTMSPAEKGADQNDQTITEAVVEFLKLPDPKVSRAPDPHSGPKL